MSIRPLDFQVTVPRTTEVAKIHSEEQQRNELVQQQQNLTVQKEAMHNTKQVHHREGANEAKVRDKQEKQNEGQEKKKKRNNYNAKSEEEESTISTIDIRL